MCFPFKNLDNYYEQKALPYENPHSEQHPYLAQPCQRCAFLVRLGCQGQHDGTKQPGWQPAQLGVGRTEPHVRHG